MRKFIFLACIFVTSFSCWGELPVTIDQGTRKKLTDSGVDAGTSSTMSRQQPVGTAPKEEMERMLNCVGPKLGRLIGAAKPIPKFAVRDAECGEPLYGFVPHDSGPENCWLGAYYYGSVPEDRLIEVVMSDWDEFYDTLAHEVAHWRQAGAGYEDDEEHGTLFKIAQREARLMLPKAVEQCKEIKDAGQ